ncbi:MAG: CHAT domain-containing protein [Synechococcales cyanobacterium RU_4_20]|nr:CHAT domain-containing protein [Synechococcales cyanobacterium RU_4_20]
MPIMLADRLELLIQLPDGHLEHYASAVEQRTLEKLLQEFRYYLVVRSRDNYLPTAQKLYDLLIRPLEATLAEHQIQTLVFLLDSSLNAIPMAALHDGQHYLIETYQVAIAPTLALKDPKPMSPPPCKPSPWDSARPGKGCSIAPRGNGGGCDRPPCAPKPGSLMNQEFTEVGLRDRITANQFPIVHIATHGQFSSDPADTFLLAWDSPIPVRSLDRMFQGRAGQAIELLVLSACQTAVGDRRATLGIAGMAIQAGARSTLATLWAVDDQATAQLMDGFYTALPQMSRAKALRQAQLMLLQDPQYAHPIYWAPYVLLGNWL